MAHMYIDIETAPDLDAVRKFTPPFDAESLKLGNVRDEAKRAERIKEAETAYYDKAFRNAALNPDTARIVAIGYAAGNGPVRFLINDEATILSKFFSLCSVFYYWGGSSDAIGFDERFIKRRSWVNGVMPPFNLNMINLTGRWTQQPHSFASLNHVARVLGVIDTVEVCDKEGLDVTGADFHLMLSNPETRQAALDYLANDVKMLRAVAARMGY